MTRVTRLPVCTYTHRFTDSVQVGYDLEFLPAEPSTGSGIEIERITARTLWVRDVGHDLQRATMTDGPSGTSELHSHAAAWESLLADALDDDAVYERVCEACESSRWD